MKQVEVDYMDNGSRTDIEDFTLQPGASVLWTVQPGSPCQAPWGCHSGEEVEQEGVHQVQ